jgi:uncharacterized protein YbaP (TraB family)
MKTIFLKRAKELSFALFISCSAVAQTPIFEISGNGLSKPSYLIGTMHLGCKEYQVLPAQFRKFLLLSDALVLEMNLKKISEQVVVASKSVVPKEHSLDLLMGEKYLVFKEEVKKNYDLDVSNILRFHPLMTSSLLVAKLLPCAQPKGSESFLMEVADSLKKKIIGLETGKEQASILFSVPDSEAVKTLWEMGTNKGKTQKDWDDLQHVFAGGNIDSIAKFIEKSDEMKMDLEKMLYERNRNWVNTLPALMIKQSLFIAVGAGHLGGSNGVVSLLKQAGYTVVEKQRSP